MRSSTVAVLVALGLTAAACTGNDNPVAVESNAGGGITDQPTDSTPTDTTPAATITWEPFGDESDDPNVEIGSIEVPIDHDDPSAGTFDLYVARHLADPEQRIGSLLVNPGGPGFGGSDFAIYATQVYSEALLTHFDIVGWDPRGTGLSEPAIDCIDDYDRYFASTDITPDDDAERQEIIDLAEEFQELCAERNAAILQHVGTNDTARDMDAIRRALGEETISYFGFSYGSELGAAWATMFPDTVRAAVLDGAADPNADFVTGGLQQSKGFEESTTEFLAQCSDDPDCAFHNDGDAEGAFDALMAELDETPVPSLPGRPDVTRGVALSAVVEAMYSESLWPTLAQGLADAQEGDGVLLLSLYDQYFQRCDDGTYDNSLEAFQTISCMDDATRLTVEEEDALAQQFIDVAPRVSPGTTGSYFCSFYPPADDPRVTITGAGAGPILVVGTTGDAATPLSSTEAMAATLEEGVLLVVVANQHTGYGVNECSFETIDDYLVDLEIPEDGRRCE